MDPVSPLPALAVLLLAFAVGLALTRLFGALPPRQHNIAIDGLRGYLALAVFIHHASVWYFFLRTDNWNVPPSNLYTAFGGAGVALFFMITAFLFCSKLIEARRVPIDWLRLGVSRVLRLAPLYLFVMLIVFAIVAILSDGKLRESLPAVLIEAARWLGFTIAGMPDINGVEGTALIVAGATWSLPYEWFFYLSLPLLALVIRAKVGLGPIVFSVIALSMMLWLWERPPAVHFVSFAGGILAALLVRWPRLRALAETRVASVIVLACLGTIATVFPTIHAIVPMLLLTLAFVLIAGGNSLFGLLTHAVSRTLGEMAYSIYLLHGTVLLVLFRFVLGLERTEALSPTLYWACILGVTPVLLGLSFLTFRAIERPAMRSTTRLTRWLRSRRSSSGAEVAT